MCSLIYPWDNRFCGGGTRSSFLHSPSIYSKWKRHILMCGADLSDLDDENHPEKKEKMNGSAISSSKDGDKKRSES